MSDELDDRLSRRFDESEQQNDEDTEAEESQTDMSSTPSQNAQSNKTSQNAQNIKKEWNVRSFYLADELDSEVSTTYKRLDLELSESDTDLELQKTRHYYPLLVQLGLERLEEMDVTEVTEHLERPE